MRPFSINYRGAVAVDSSGNSFYAFENRIEKYNAQGDMIDNYGQDEPAKDALGEGLGHVR